MQLSAKGGLKSCNLTGQEKMVEEKKLKEDKKDEKKKVKVPKKFKGIVDEIEKMSVLDLAELVEILEDKFGVLAAAPVAVAGTAPAAEGAEGGAEEKSEYNVELVSAGDSKINVIKLVKEVTGVGLKDAKDMVDGAPKAIKENVPKEEAEEMKKKFEEAGATVELK